MELPKKPAAIIVFCSYAPGDREWRERLATHLSQLKRDGLIEEWDDQQIPAGLDRAQAINQAMHSAQLILLLISADFLASDACYQTEMQQALERHRRGEARVIPIIVHPCDWRSSPFGQLQYLPRSGKPITTWENQDEAFVALVQELRKVIVQRLFLRPSLSSLQSQNRARLLKRVRKIWIEGLLDQSLHQAAWIDLHLQKQPDALENPWRFQVQELAHPSHVLPVGTSIVEIYDEAEGELLILGEAGSGKTTLLLQLARTLLDRAEVDEQLQMPVIFNLSSWAQKQESLAVWLVKELQTKYQVPHHIGQHWIETSQVLPLLDGLDEVAEEAQDACVQAITIYYHQDLKQISTPLVVCCRSQEYQAHSLHLLLQYAVSILPLTPEQIGGYLSGVQGQLEGLQQALQSDTELYELARRPLMLSIFTLAYQGEDVAELPPKSKQEQTLHAVFESYVKRMLTRRGQLRQWKQEQFLHWLTFLAKQLHQQQQTVFSMEDMLSSWLPSTPRRLGQWSIRLFVGLLFGLCSGLMAWIFSPLFKRLASLVLSPTDIQYLSNFHLLLFLFICGVGLLLLIRGWFRRKSLLLPAQRPTLMLGKLTWKTIPYSLLWIFYFFTSLVVFDQQSAALFWGVFSLILTVVSIKFSTKSSEVISWSITWSWKRACIGLLVGLPIGLVLGWIVIWLYALSYGGSVELIAVLIAGLPSGIFLGIFYGSLGGLSGNRLTEHISSFPNEGIHRTGRNGLILGLIAGLFVGLFFGLFLGWLDGLLIGLAFGLPFGLRTGLDAFLGHFLLRFLLWKLNYFPWKVVAFLDEAAERLFLRKVGGSYIFVHRLLLDYLATLDEPASAISTSPESKV